jgi:hypothetical protein
MELTHALALIVRTFSQSIKVSFSLFWRDASWWLALSVNPDKSTRQGLS